MTLWLVLTVMIAVAAVLVSSPFIRRLERSRLWQSGDVAVYRDQLKEIENEVAQGVIDRAQADSAGIEIKRRLLAADRAVSPADRALSSHERRFAIVSVSGIVVLGSVALYAFVGSPDLPAATATAAAVTPAATPMPADSPVARLAATQSAALPSAPAKPSAAAATATQTGLPPVEEMVGRLQTRLQRNPQDADGWRMLGWSYFSIERFNEAADAYARAIELRPGVADFRSGRAEALIRSAGGGVTTEAKAELDEAIKLDPKDARARFFIGLAKEQAGDKPAALADWSSLLADASPTEPWIADLKQRIGELRSELGLGETASPRAANASGDLLEALKKADEAAASAPAAAQAPVERGPRPEDIRNAQAMAPADRAAMIRGMVDGLASRLEQSPRDADGWIKLIRSRVVLGDADLARQSLQRALSYFSEESAERTRIVDAGRQLGLSQPD
jgi:cytochrome c-type biogenesis protein CcmH